MIPKFRGKSTADENNGEWVYGNLIVDGRQASIVNGIIESTEQYISIGAWCPVDAETVGQSTGFKDKNGVEIFEGDIVKTTRFFGRADETGGFYEYDKKIMGVVKQLEGAWVIDTGSEAVNLWTEIEENSVIGNVWEDGGLIDN
ncbi:YopX family protein [Streptococcus intermedius]|uniref:YopX family protein n=1 Tax=Streptococcus intermedius TaxID=1338 RepID=UPI00123A4F26|nr:YopX family protein [Streptococcus intermedius]